MSETVNPKSNSSQNEKTVILNNRSKPKNRLEAQMYQVQEAVDRNYTHTPDLIKSQKNCKISGMAKKIIAEKISSACSRMGGNFVHSFANFKGNMDFKDLANKKNWNLEEFYAICLMELDKQKEYFEKIAGNNQTTKTKCETAYNEIKAEIETMITNEINANTQFRDIPGNEKKVLEISGKDLLKSVTDQKKKLADNVRHSGNALLFTVGVSNVITGGALALPTVLIPLLRFAGITAIDIHKINLEQLQKHKEEFILSLEGRLGDLWSEIENGNLSQNDAKTLEGKLQPFFGLVENRTDLIKILAKIQTCKQNSSKEAITSNNLKQENSAFGQISKLSTPSYWNSLKSTFDHKNLSNGWKMKLSWNLAQVVGFGLVEIGVGSYIANRNPFGYISKGIQDSWENTVGKFIPNIETPKNLPISTKGLPPPTEAPNPVATPNIDWQKTPNSELGNAFEESGMVKAGQNVTSQNIVLGGESFFQKSLNVLNNLFPGINSNVPSNSFLARMIEKTVNNPGNIPQGMNPAHWTLQNWAGGNKVPREVLKTILDNPAFANLNNVRDLAHLNPNQIEILTKSLPKIEQQNEFYLAFTNNVKFAEMGQRSYAGAVEAMKNSAIFGAMTTSFVVLVANLWKPKNDKIKAVKNVALAGGTVAIGLVGAAPIAIGTGAILGGKALYNKSAGQKTEKINLVEDQKIKEINRILARIKDELSSIVDENGQITSQKMLEEILIKVLQDNLYETGTETEIKKSLIEEFNILSNFENEKNKTATKNYSGFYKKLVIIIEEVLGKNEVVSTENLESPQVPSEIDNQEIENFANEQEQIENLQNKITSLLTTPKNEFNGKTLQQKIAIVLAKEDTLNLFEKTYGSKPYSPEEFESFVTSLIPLKNLGENLDYDINGLKKLFTFLKSLTTAFVEIDKENNAQSGVEVEIVNPRVVIPPEEDEDEPEIEIELKPEKEIETEEMKELRLKNELFKLGKTKIEGFSYIDILKQLQTRSITPLLRNIGFQTYDQVIKFTKEFTKETNFNDLLKYVVQTNLGNTATTLGNDKGQRTSEQLQNQIKITQKAIKLIKEKVAELENQNTGQIEADSTKENQENMTKTEK